MGKNYDIIIFILRKPRPPIFADIVKIVTMFIKIIFKDSKKSKELEIMYQNSICIWYFLIKKNLLISNEKMLILAELKGCVTWFIYFLDLP